MYEVGRVTAPEPVQEMQEVYSITAGRLRNIQTCNKSFEFSLLGVHYENYESKKFMRKAIRKVMEYLSTGEKDYQSYVYSLFDNDYMVDWFSSKVQYDMLKVRDIKRVLRITNYVVEQGYSVVKTNEEYSLNTPIKINGYTINCVAGKFDFILKKEDKLTAVLIKSGEPKYSDRARSEEKLCKNSIELLASYLGSCQKHDTSQFNVELWYLKNKDDTGATLVDKFEHRKGKNIVTSDYSSKSFEELVTCFNKVLSFRLCMDCSSCIHSCICKTSSKVVKETSTLKKESKKPEEPTKVQYTKEQETVINFVNGQMCVVAVPGAGKTYSLVKRMVTLIKKGVHPTKILFLTFTKKAAKEIESRVDKELKPLGITTKPTISTFNGFGYSILQDNPMYVGKRIKLATEVDRYSLIFKAISRCPYIKGVSYDGLEGEYGLIRTLDRLFDEILQDGIQEFKEHYAERKDVEGHLRVYEMYRMLYEKAGYINYDQQINLVNELFEKYSVLTKRYAKIFEYIMVDEYQDSSEEQVELLYSIARQHGNLVVVGDDDQSVYGWRNGSSKYMLEFMKDFPSAHMVYMEDNFRSHAGILAASNALIENNGVRYAKSLKGHINDLGKPILVKGVDADYLKRIINSALKQGYQPGEIAILSRNNDRLAEVQRVLDGFVSLSSPKDYMIEDGVFLAIFDMLTLYYKGMDNDVALYRLFKYREMSSILNKRNARESFYQNLLDEDELYPIAIGEPLCVQRYEMSKESSPIIEIGKCIVRCFEKIYSEKIEIILKDIVQNIFGIESHLVVDNLIDAANIRGLVKIKDLYELMTDMITYTSMERVGYGISMDSVNLLTCHDSKGKEFRNVIIYGVEDISEEEEEVRVLYVAMTRAIKNLFLVETSQNKYSTLDKILPYVKVMGGQ